MPRDLPFSRRNLLRTVALTSAAAWVGGLDLSTGQALAQEAAGFSPRLPGGEWHYPAAEALIPFGHGVASGDPLSDRVILWTRITIPDARGWDTAVVPDPQGFDAVTVGWVVATDPALTDVISSGTVITDADVDFTVKIDADDLRSATTYWYAFTALGFRSPIGRTRTAPAPGDPITELTFGHISCSSWWTDWFNGYGRMGVRGDLDLITHAGDHVYEVTGNHQASRFYPGPDGNPQLQPYDDLDNRAWRNVAECRRRYALYYQGPNMLAAHLAAPFAILPDQHDYTGFVDDGSGGDSEVPAAGEVMYEWSPMRPPLPDGSGAFGPSPGPSAQVPVPRGEAALYSYRHLPYGDLADVILIDARRHTQIGATDSVLLGDVQWAWLLGVLGDSGARGVTHRYLVNQSNMSEVALEEANLTGPVLELVIQTSGSDGAVDGAGWLSVPGERAALYQFLRDNAVIDNIFTAGNMHGWFGSDLVEQNAPPFYIPGTSSGTLQIVGVEMVGTSGGGRPGLQDIIADEAYWRANGGRETAPFDGAETYDATYRPAALPIATAGQEAVLQGTPNMRHINWLAQYGYTMFHLRSDKGIIETWTTPQRNLSTAQTLLTQHRTVVGDPRLVEIANPTPVSGTRSDPTPVAETIPLGAVVVERVAGTGRHQTAAMLSAASYPPGIEVAYVAGAGGFADALSAGPLAAIEGAPLLLVDVDRVPSETQTELSRLQPRRIVVVGGPLVVSDAILAELSALAPGGAARRGGADRYQTAATASSAVFPVGVPVSITVGTDFPDALAGGFAAVAVKGPLLLTLADALPQSTRQEVERLQPVSITVFGGPSAVSESVVAELAAIAPTTRVSGTTRYDTAALATADLMPGGTVYLATGENFPDALAGTAAAGVGRSTALLVQRQALPASTRDALQRLAPTRVVILGGTAAVEESVVEAVQAALE